MLLGEPRVTRVTTGLVPEDKPPEDEVEDAEDSSFWDSPSRATVKGLQNGLFLSIIFLKLNLKYCCILSLLFCSSVDTSTK